MLAKERVTVPLVPVITALIVLPAVVFQIVTSPAVASAAVTPLRSVAGWISGADGARVSTEMSSVLEAMFPLPATSLKAAAEVAMEAVVSVFAVGVKIAE